MCIVKIYDAAAAVGTGIDYIISCSSSTLRIFVMTIEKHCMLCHLTCK